jgi:hypothetical protein
VTRGEMSMLGGRMVRPAIMTIIGVLILILIRLGIDQTQWYGIGVAKIQAGDKKEAIMYFDRVLNAHIPFSPIEDKARSHLLSLASEFENKNEHELALLCYETMRSSQYMTRSFYLPFSKDIPSLNNKIASLNTRFLVKEGFVNDSSAEYRHQMEILQRAYSPSICLSLVTIISFIAYIVSVIGWIINHKKNYMFAGLLFFVVWIITLYSA